MEPSQTTSKVSVDALPDIDQSNVMQESSLDLSVWITKIKELRNMHAGNAAISEVLLEAMQAIQAQALAQDNVYSSDTRISASASLMNAKQLLLDVKLEFQSEEFDAQAFLQKYADGCSSMRQGCDSLLVDMSPADWDASDIGAYGCSTLAQIDTGIWDLVRMAQDSSGTSRKQATSLQLQARGEALLHLDGNNSSAFRIGGGAQYDFAKPGGVFVEAGVVAYQRNDIDESVSPPDIRLIQGPQAYTGIGWRFPNDVAAALELFPSYDVKATVDAHGKTEQKGALGVDAVVRLEYKDVNLLAGYLAEDSFYLGLGLTRRFNTFNLQDAPSGVAYQSESDESPVSLQYHLQFSTNIVPDNTNTQFALPSAGVKARVGPQKRIILQTGVNYFVGGSGNSENPEVPLTYSTGPQVFAGAGVKLLNNGPEIIANAALENTKVVYMGNSGGSTSQTNLNVDASLQANYRFLFLAGGYSTSLDAPYIGIGIYYDGDIKLPQFRKEGAQ